MDLGAGVSDSIQKLLGNSQQVDFELLNYLISNVEVEKIKTIYSSAILRYTSYYKDQLSEWNILMEKIEKQCVKNNINPEEVLIGLKD